MEWQKWAIIVGAIVAGATSIESLVFFPYQALVGGVLVLIGAFVK